MLFSVAVPAKFNLDEAVVEVALYRTNNPSKAYTVDDESVTPTPYIATEVVPEVKSYPAFKR